MLVVLSCILVGCFESTSEPARDPTLLPAGMSTTATVVAAPDRVTISVRVENQLDSTATIGVNGGCVVTLLVLDPKTDATVWDERVGRACYLTLHRISITAGQTHEFRHVLTRPITNGAGERLPKNIQRMAVRVWLSTGQMVLPVTSAPNIVE